MTRRQAVLGFVVVSMCLAFASIFIGDGLAPAVLVAAPIAFASMYFCHKADTDGRMGMVAIFALAVGLRFGLATFIHSVVYRSAPGAFSPDEIWYDQASRLQAEHFLGHLPDQFPYGGTPGVVWLGSTCYALLGYAPLLPKFLNCVAGGWTAVLAGLIASRIYSPAVARRAALIAALAPSLMLWSSLNTKDNWALLGVEAAAYAFVLLRERFRPWLLALLGFALAFIAFHRTYEVVFLGAGIIGSFLVGLRKNLVRNIVVMALVGGTLLFVVQRYDAVTPLLGVGDQTSIERFNELRSAYTEAGSAIDISIVDTSTPIGVLIWVPIGLVYFFMTPVPFTGTSAISLATSPEMLIWYLFLPSLWRALRSARRDGRLERLSPLLLYVLASSIGWSIVVTNMGSLFRYRGQVLFLPIILIAADQVARASAKARRHHELLGSLLKGQPEHDPARGATVGESASIRLPSLPKS